MDNIIINNAADRYNQRLNASRDGYVRVDEYSPEQLMAFALEFGCLINYFNNDNRVDGDWVGFFATDKAILYAWIAATDINRIEERFETAFFKARGAVHFHNKFNHLKEVFEQIEYPARLFNLFLKILNRQPVLETAVLKQELTEIIQVILSPELRKLKAYDEGAASRNALDKKIGLHYQEFLPVWNIHQVPPDDHIYGGRTLNAKIDCALGYLKPLFDVFIDQLIFIKRFAQSLLPDALAAPHKPHIALYLSFLKLFNTARTNLDSLTPRYRDFYYLDILRQKKRSYIPDKVFLACTLADDEGLTGAWVKKDNLFSAGTDENGQAILYAADQDLWVTKATINKVYSLFTQYKPIINYPPVPPNQDCGCTPVPPSGPALAGIYAGDWLQPGEDGQPGLPAKDFGALGNDTLTPLNQYAAVGFTIASNSLLLTGGNRQVSVGFFIAAASQQVIAAYLQEISVATGQSQTAVLKYILENSFELYVTTESGWLRADSYEVKPGPYPESRFIISFSFPSAAPAITSLLNPDTGEAEGLPSARFIARQGALYFDHLPQLYIYPIGLLGKIRLSEIVIDISVQNFGNITLSSNGSDIDAGAPFNPFGGIPVMGSSLDIASEELFSKQITSLDIGVDWFDIPRNETGFKGYYKYYVLDAGGGKLHPRISNNSFKVKIQTLNPGSWELKYPSGDDGNRNLFATQIPGGCTIDDLREDDSPLCPTTLFDALPVSSHKTPEYYTPSGSRIRIELTNPVYAFANDLYPINLMNAVIKDLPSVSGCEETCKKKCGDDADCLKTCMEKCLIPIKELAFPQPPYTPSAAAVSVSYTCSTSLSFNTPLSGSNIFFHTMPFDGFRPVTTALPLLLPDFYEGNLILGFSGLSGAQTLSLLFCMQDTGSLPPDNAPDICWSYLSGNQWIFLGPSDLLSDGTNHFRNTGIIRLRLPSFDGNNNTVLSPDLVWIRASTQKNALTVAPVVGIYPHALAAHWRDNSNTTTHLEKPLPAFTIQKAEDDIPGIKDIIQPLESFGGRPAETDEQLVVRTGDRLAHKQRAVLPQDYEKLVLQQFPAICKVKCLPHHSLHKAHAPGHVLVVVVQGPDTDGRVNPQTPMATQAMLDSIKTWLANISSPFVTLETANPVYVKIKVICTVQFIQDSDSGQCLQQLNHDLLQYLSPWYYDGAREAKAGNYTSLSDISGFIQTRPYIAFLDELQLDYDPLPASLDTNWYFLTSAASHSISEAGEKNCEP